MAWRANRNVIDGDLVVSGTIHTQSVNAPGIAKVVTESAGTTENVRRIEVETIPGVQASADEKSKTWIQASEPTIGSRPDAINGDYWVDSDDSNRTYVAKANVWVEERASTVADTANSLASKASQAQNGGSDGSAFTATPAVPTISVAAVKRGVVISIPKQANLLNPAGYRVQISVDNSTWYCPNIAASTDSDDYKTGAANGYLAVSDETLTLGFLPIPLVDGVPQAAGRLYYFRAARVGATVSGYTTPAVPATVKPTTNADMAALAVRTAQVDLANYIKARNPSAALDGLECLLSMEDVPCIPTNPQGTLYLFKDGGGNLASGWSSDGTPAPYKNASGELVFKYDGYFFPSAVPAGTHFRIRVKSSESGAIILSTGNPTYTNQDEIASKTAGANEWVTLDGMLATGATFICFHGPSVSCVLTVNSAYVGDGSYTPLIPDNIEGQRYWNDANWGNWTKAGTGSMSVVNGVLTIDGASWAVYGSSPAWLPVSPGQKIYVRARQPSGTLGNLLMDNGGAGFNFGALSTDWQVFSVIVPAGISCVQDVYRSNYSSAAGTLEVSDIYVGDGTFSGDYHDQSGKGREVKYYGVVPCEGIAGSGLRAGNGRYAVLPSVPVFYGISLWFRTSSSSAMPLSGGSAGTVNGLWYVQIGQSTSGYSDESISIVVFSPGGAMMIYGMLREGEAKYADGKWHHLVVDLSGTDSVGNNNTGVTVDGVKKTLTWINGGPSTAYPTPAGAMYIGRYANDANYATGDFDIDEARFFNRHLTDDEIAYLYSNPSGPIPAMFGAHRIVADSITAREVAADTGLFAKIKTSNLEVDAYGSITNLNAGLVYCGANADATDRTSIGGRLLTSPSPYAGKYALNYFDLANGKFRVGDTVSYMWWNGSTVQVVGNFKLSGAYTYFENSDGKVRITPDNTLNTFGTGLVMCSRALGDALVNGDVKCSWNYSSNSSYVGFTQEWRLASGGSYGTTYRAVDCVEFYSSGSGRRSYQQWCGSIYAYSGCESISSEANHIDKVYYSSTRSAEASMLAQSGWVRFLVTLNGPGLGGQDATSYLETENTAILGTTYTNWFQPTGNHAGFIFFSDIAAGGSSYGFGWYARNATGAVYNNLGGTTQAQASGNYIQVKGANASYKMTFQKIRML